jgi:hypothetical protein
MTDSLQGEGAGAGENPGGWDIYSPLWTKALWAARRCLHARPRYRHFIAYLVLSVAAMCLLTACLAEQHQAPAHPRPVPEQKAKGVQVAAGLGEVNRDGREEQGDDVEDEGDALTPAK